MSDEGRLEGYRRDAAYLASALKYRVVYYMEDYKVLAGTMINMLLTFTGYLVLWSVILENTDSFQGVYKAWDIGSIIMLIGFSELAFALDSLVMYGLSLIPSIVNEEGLEPYSVYPVSTLAVILGRHSEPIDGIAGLVWSLIFISSAHLVYGVPLNLAGLLAGILLLLLGATMIGLLYLTLASLSFRYGVLEAPMDLVTTVYVSFSRVPHDIFPSVIRLALTLLLPVALLSTYPTLLATGAIGFPMLGPLMLAAAASALLLALLAHVAWSRGRRMYQPVGG